MARTSADRLISDLKKELRKVCYSAGEQLKEGSESSRVAYWKVNSRLPKKRATVLASLTALGLTFYAKHLPQGDYYQMTNDQLKKLQNMLSRSF